MTSEMDSKRSLMNTNDKEMQSPNPRPLETGKGVAKMIDIATRHKPMIGTLLVICICVLVACIITLVVIIRQDLLTGPAEEMSAALENARSSPLKHQRPNTNDTVAMQAYFRELYEQQEERLRQLGCKPVKQVVKIVTVLKEIGEYNALRDVLKPFQAVVVRRCLAEESYCPKTGDKCIPTVGAPRTTKKIGIEIYNATSGQFVPIIREAEEHSSCTCQCQNTTQSVTQKESSLLVGEKQPQLNDGPKPE